MGLWDISNLYYDNFYTISHGITYIMDTGVPIYINYTISGNNYEWVQTSLHEDPYIPNSLNLSTFPNPFNPSTTVEFTTKKGVIYSIDLYNMLGQKLKTLHSGPLPLGRSTFQLDGQGLASGIYLIRAVGGGEVISHKVVLIK